MLFLMPKQQCQSTERQLLHAVKKTRKMSPILPKEGGGGKPLASCVNLPPRRENDNRKRKQIVKLTVTDNKPLHRISEIIRQDHQYYTCRIFRDEKTITVYETHKKTRHLYRFFFELERPHSMSRRPRQHQELKEV